MFIDVIKMSIAGWLYLVLMTPVLVNAFRQPTHTQHVTVRLSKYNRNSS